MSGSPLKGLVLAFKLRRILPSHLLQIFLPSIILIILIYSTNYIPSYYVDSIIICSISLLSLTALLLLHSSSLSPSPHIKMSDTWLLASHAAALLQILLLLRMNCTSLELEVCQRLMSAIVLPKVDEEDKKHKVAAATHVGERPPKVILI